MEEHQRREILRSYGLEPRHRLLFVGPPGNGKTSLYEGVIGSYLGETAGRLGQLFDHVRTRPCVLFFDEFDTLGKERGDTHETGEIKRVVSSLLLQIDDLPSHVVVVTATNHDELLDRAVWRRFQLRLELPRPGRAMLTRWFEQFTKRSPAALEYQPRTLAERLDGLSFAEVEGHQRVTSGDVVVHRRSPELEIEGTFPRPDGHSVELGPFTWKDGELQGAD